VALKYSLSLFASSPSAVVARTARMAAFEALSKQLADQELAATPTVTAKAITMNGNDVKSDGDNVSAATLAAAAAADEETEPIFSPQQMEAEQLMYTILSFIRW
jgi:hypothetical protein